MQTAKSRGCMKSSGSEKKTSSPLLIADPDPNWIRIRVLCGSEDKDLINHLETQLIQIPFVTVFLIVT